MTINLTRATGTQQKPRLKKIGPSAKIPTVTLWPSGDLTLGYAPAPKPEPEEAEPQSGEEFYATSYPAMIEGIDNDTEAWGHFALALEAEGRTEQAFTAYEAFTRTAERRTGLSDALKSHKIAAESRQPLPVPERAPRGTNGISAYGKRSLKSCGAIMEKRHPRSVLTFTTCTVPSVSSEKLRVICDEWPEITRRFQQELRRELRRHELPLDYFGCSEVQPLRWERDGVIAPHLHFCFVGRRNRYRPWAINHEWISETWGRILRDVIDSDFDNRATCETRGVQKSVGREIGKYLSKGGAVIAAIRKAGRGAELPRAYWNAPFHLRAEIRELKHHFRGDCAAVLHNSWKALNELGLTQLREIFVDLPVGERSPPRQFLAGFTGWIRGDAISLVKTGEIWDLYLAAMLLQN